jgi:hypothetical protein
MNSVEADGIDQFYPWHPGSHCVRGWAKPQSWSGFFGKEKDLFTGNCVMDFMYIYINTFL